MRLLKKSDQSSHQAEKTWNSPEYKSAVNRVRSMSTHDMIIWADEAGTQMCRVLSDYSGERDPNVRAHLLDELRVAISAFQAITERLMDLEFLLS